MTPLEAAISARDIDTVQTLLQNGIELHEENENPLHLAVVDGNLEITKLLVQHGVIYQNDELDYNELHVAASHGRTDILEYLLQMRGGHDSSGASEDTPLHSAARAGSVGCVRLLLQRGVDVNAGDFQGRTPLYYAAENGDGSVIQLLVESGARIGTVDEMGESALWVAAKHGNVEGVRMLLGSGVDHRNRYGETVLHAGAYGGSLEIIKLLIDAGAHITAHSRSGTSPLHRAAEGGKAELVKWLLDTNKFDVNEYTSHGWTPILLAALHNEAATAKSLLDYGAGIGTSSILGFSPLHLACRYTKLDDPHRPETDDTELIEMLLYNGADIMALASESIGSVWSGEEGEYMQEEFSARIQNYQPVNPSHHRIFPLHCATTSGSIAKTKFLLDHGAEINAADYLGRTAIFDTFETSPELYHFMLERGADLNLVDRRGLTAVQSYCYAYGPRGTRSFLIAADAYDPSMDWQLDRIRARDLVREYENRLKGGSS